MGWLDLFRRKKRDAGPPPPRIDYLLGLYHGWLEEPHDAYDGRNFLGLVDKHIAEGRIDLALFNLDSQVKYCATLANLYWGQGQVDRARPYLEQAVERHQRRAALCAEWDRPCTAYGALADAKAAAVLLGLKSEEMAPTESPEPGYDPWFKDALMTACVGAAPFDMTAWQANKDLWTRRRFPKYRQAEYDFYVGALTGQFDTADAMIAAHAKMFAGRAKRSNADWDLLDGYRDNDLVIDALFAAILKRIGWDGVYRHSWPTTHADPGFVLTSREPDRHVAVDAGGPPSGSATARPSGDALVTDPVAARVLIDRALASQTDDEGTPLDARRPARERHRVAAALAGLGWRDDADALALMQAYRMDLVRNPASHLTLGDPVRRDAIGLADWTRLLIDEFGLHPDFIAIAGSEDKRDYRDPQGAWYVYWKADGRIYAVERDEWDRPAVATADASEGLTLWPNYLSFVAWWVGQGDRT